MSSAARIEIAAVLPANETLVVRLPFRKVFRRWNSFRPDAERGLEIEYLVLQRQNDHGAQLTTPPQTFSGKKDQR